MKKDNKERKLQDGFKPFPTWKRILDLCFIAGSLPFTVPLGALISLYIKLVSPGPVIFRQVRIGIHGQKFMCLKFRTMHVGADNSRHKDYLGQLINSQVPMIKMDARGDSRIIPGGSLLRAMGLDELPQLINVLHGDMSVVGPRPCIPYEFEQYTEAQRRRFGARPGLTGLWQVSGKNRTTFDQMIGLDVQYAERQSLGLDLYIMARTPVVLLEQLFSRFSPPRRGVAASLEPVDLKRVTH